MALETVTYYVGAGVSENASTPRQKKRLRAGSFLNASVSDMNDRRPVATDIYSDQIFNDRERCRARAASRKLFCDNPSALHMACSQMLSVAGTPPNVQFRTPDLEVNRSLEESFRDWANRSDFWDVVSMMVLSIPYDGESFVRVKNLGTENLSFVPLEPKRVSSPPQKCMEPNVLDGIEYDNEETPSAYYVERKCVNPGVFRGLIWDRIPSLYMLHFYIPFFPEQHRGFPMFDASERPLRSIEELRQELIEYTRTGARLHGVITMDQAMEDEENSPEAMDVVDMPRKGLLMLGNNMQASQFKQDTPGVNFRDFWDMNATVAGAGTMLPRNIATNDSSNYNFSSARLDHMIFSRWCKFLRRKLRKVLNRAIDLWLVSHWHIPEVSMALYRCGGVASVPRETYFEDMELDEKTKTDVAVTRVRNNMQSLKSWYAERNEDWESQIDQIALEKKRLQEKGLVVEDIGTLPNVPTVPPIEGEDTGLVSIAPPPEALPNLRSAAQLSEQLGCSRGQIAGWRRLGLPSYRLGGRVMYDLEKVKEFIESGSCGGNQDE